MFIREMKKEDNVKVKEIIQDSLKSLGLAIPGTAYFDPQLNDLHQLQKLYLSPKAQGLGLSKKLMETALSFASKHYEKCYLETMHELKTACLLYEKFGFTLLHEPLPGSEHSAMDAWYMPV